MSTATKQITQLQKTYKLRKGVTATKTMLLPDEDSDNYNIEVRIISHDIEVFCDEAYHGKDESAANLIYEFILDAAALRSLFKNVLDFNKELGYDIDDMLDGDELSEHIQIEWPWIGAFD